MQDVIAVWKALFAEEKPPVVLVGHSMGGAIAVRTAATKVSVQCSQSCFSSPAALCLMPPKACHLP